MLFHIYSPYTAVLGESWQWFSGLPVSRGSHSQTTFPALQPASTKLRWRFRYWKVSLADFKPYWDCSLENRSICPCFCPRRLVSHLDAKLEITSTSEVQGDWTVFWPTMVTQWSPVPSPRDGLRHVGVNAKTVIKLIELWIWPINGFYILAQWFCLLLIWLINLTNSMCCRTVDIGETNV